MVNAVETNNVGDDKIIVSKPVMDYILKCQHPSENDQREPVHKTNIGVESGTTSQQVSVVGLEELRESLKKAIESDEVTTGIIDRIEKAVISNKPTFRHSECPPTSNIINIDVPPHELEVFHARMERVMQQNNNILLGLINDMISTKFTTVENNLNKLIHQKADKIYQKLDLLLANAGVEIKDADQVSEQVATMSEDFEVSPEIPTEPSDSTIIQKSPESNSISEVIDVITMARPEQTTLAAEGTEAASKKDKQSDTPENLVDHVSNLSAMLQGTINLKGQIV